MKTLYLDCGMGAAGDMLTASLYELLDDDKKEEFIEKINSIGIPKVNVDASKMIKCGIAGTHITVTVNGMEEEVADESVEHNHTSERDGHHHNHEHHNEPEAHEHRNEHSHERHHHHDHHHSGMHEIEHIIEGLQVSEKVKADVLNVYGLIAEAESKAHDCHVSEVHFHEVGAMDAIADVTAVCMLFEEINADNIIASPIHVGSGHVHCAHGVLPVPAPATAFILKGVPTYSGRINGELCTPTGAALLKYFVNDYASMPVMRVERIGYGMGKKEFHVINCVRALLGETEEETNQVLELTCNVDDMTPEKIGFAMERLFEAGALEVYTIPVGMKKSRPGTMICVMCSEGIKDEIIKAIFKHTTTIGLRENISRRYVLNREIETIDSPFGSVRVKHSKGYGVERMKYEYEDICRIAKERGMSIEEVENTLDNKRRLVY